MNKDTEVQLIKTNRLFFFQPRKLQERIKKLNLQYELDKKRL